MGVDEKSTKRRIQLGLEPVETRLPSDRSVEQPHYSKITALCTPRRPLIVSLEIFWQQPRRSISNNPLSTLPVSIFEPIVGLLDL